MVILTRSLPSTSKIVVSFVGGGFPDPPPFGINMTPEQQLQKDIYNSLLYFSSSDEKKESRKEERTSNRKKKLTTYLIREAKYREGSRDRISENQQKYASKRRGQHNIARQFYYLSKDDKPLDKKLYYQGNEQLSLYWFGSKTTDLFCSRTTNHYSTAQHYSLDQY